MQIRQKEFDRNYVFSLHRRNKHFCQTSSRKQYEKNVFNIFMSKIKFRRIFTVVTLNRIRESSPKNMTNVKTIINVQFTLVKHTVFPTLNIVRYCDANLLFLFYLYFNFQNLRLETANINLILHACTINNIFIEMPQLMARGMSAAL